jgi:predicted phosphoribosyltransferase
MRQSAAFQLDETVKRVARHVPTATGLLRDGFAWHEITKAAAELGADLVVVGSHGRRDRHRFLIGSVAEKVARVCPVPVLTVHAWRFEDRTEGGRELAEVVLRSEEPISTVIAVSRAAALVGSEVAEAFGAPLHVLLTRTLERDGCVFGAVCEDDSVHLYAQADGQTARLSDREQGEEARARTELAREGQHLRSPRWVEDGKAGTILLVSDAIFDAAPTLVAAKVLRASGPHRLVAAAPVATRAAREALAPAVDRVIVVQTVESLVPLGRVYHDMAQPDDRTVVERVVAAAQWAEVVDEHGG